MLRIKALLSSRRLSVLLLVGLCLVIVQVMVAQVLYGRIESAIAKLKATGHRTTLSEFREPSCRPQDNAAPYYRAAWEIADGAAPLPNLTIERFLAEDSRALEDGAPALELLALASQKPACWMKLKYDPDTANEANYLNRANYAGGRGLAILATADAVKKLQRGDINGGCARLRQLSLAIRRVDLGSTLLGQSFRLSFTRLLVEALKYVPRDQWATQPALQEELGQLMSSLKSGWPRSLDFERSAAILTFNQLRAGQRDYYGVASWSRSNPLEISPYTPLGNVWLELDELQFLELFGRSEADIEAGLPTSTKPVEFAHPVTAMLFPNLSSLHKRQIEVVSGLAAYLH